MEKVSSLLETGKFPLTTPRPFEIMKLKPGTTRLHKIDTDSNHIFMAET